MLSRANPTTLLKLTCASVRERVRGCERPSLPPQHSDKEKKKKKEKKKEQQTEAEPQPPKKKRKKKKKQE